MNFRSKMHRDRSGVSAIVVVAIVIIVIVAAAAVYVLWSGNDDEKKEYGTGTTFTYDVTGQVSESQTSTITGTATIEIYGQNSTQYFLKDDITYGDVMASLAEQQSIERFILSEKDGGVPVGAENKGVEEVETVDGLKSLEVWEYTIDDVKVTVFVEKDTGIVYRQTMAIVDEQGPITLQTDLKSKDLKYQDSYTESDAIGKTYTYSVNEGSTVTTDVFTIKCIADCIDSQYGMVYTLGDDAPYYYPAVSPQGLPADAVDTATTSEIDTIDGKVTTEVWTITDDQGDVTTFYVDSESSIVYQITIAETGEPVLTMALTEKS